ncbi:hypothetical protein [Bdellovibrio sp. HCB274]|uniref:helix-turn-helix domain-containing protein n=1 Tax=Bdellovibrio sp. HCB274 TaxID=3394361 RepID=UPI0039B3668E
MGSEFVEIDGDALKELLQSKLLSRFDLAVQLRVSPKTVQRWLNHTILKVKPDTIERIAEVLAVDPNSIRRNRHNLKIRPVNKALAEFCSEKHFDQVRLKDNWQHFRQVLKGVKLEELPSEQQMEVCRNIGISSFYLGKFRSATLYLKNALRLAESLSQNEMRANILVWKARLNETLGDFPKSLSFLETAETFFSEATRLSVIAEHSYVLGRVHMHQGRNEEAVLELRRGIMLSYRQQSKRHGLLIAWSYVMLTYVYFRLKDYRRAEVTVRRLGRSAERLGWSRGLVLANYYQGILAAFQGQNPEISRQAFGKARATLRATEIDRFCPQLAQAAFIYHILTGRHEEAKASMVDRLHKTRHATHLWSQAVLDGLLLAKLSPGMNTVRGSMVEAAKDHFQTYQVELPLELMNRLQGRSGISAKEIPDFYYF